MAHKTKISPREKRKNKIRKRLKVTLDRPRLSIFRSSKHIYGQIISDLNHATVATASTLETEVIEELKKLKVEAPKGDAAPKEISRSTKSVLAARAVGIVLARRGKEKNISTVVFDRNGFNYHGRVKALADGAREGGLDF